MANVTLVWAKGLRFPLGWLGSRLMCPRWGSRDVSVIFEPPPRRSASPVVCEKIFSCFVSHSSTARFPC